MKLNRTDFQDESAAIESLLAEYINMYPRNMGHVAQWNIAFVFILLGVALLCLGCNSNEDITMLGVLSLIGGITMWLAYRYFKHNDVDPQLAGSIRARARALSDKAGDYDEVQRYCDNIIRRVDGCEAYKKILVPKFFAIVAIIAAAITIVLPFHQIEPFQPPVNDFKFSVMASEPSQQYGDSMTVELFMDIGSLSPDNSDTVIDMDLRIKIFAMVMSDSQREAFQLLFVDSSGAPAPMCPKLTIKDGTGEYGYSLPLCHAIRFKSLLSENKLRYKINPIYSAY